MDHDSTYDCRFGNTMDRFLSISTPELNSEINTNYRTDYYLVTAIYQRHCQVGWFKLTVYCCFSSVLLVDHGMFKSSLWIIQNDKDGSHMFLESDSEVYINSSAWMSE